ncbi:carbohydrate sulfotransferase 8 isoform X2 [Microcaecilia unicolor]|uniref:Carbohydrate sulfotransferase n=1 Tax=Microcaecilia unicolor TaxID=1415580 RepID=A0A6P7Z6B4_9AMPH|nr:carbohydrate sulfotransferase 8-like isoform X2 [Microcaecilia unicolor]
MQRSSTGLGQSDGPAPVIPQLVLYERSSWWIFFLRQYNGPTQTWEISQMQRKLILNSTCMKYNLTNQAKRLNPHVAYQLFVMPSHKIIFCSVPKAGCSNWKRIFLLLAMNMTNETNALDNENINRSSVLMNIHSTPLLRRLISYPSMQQLELLNNYTKMMFTRDPFERLVSAYRDKLLHVNPAYTERFINPIKAAFQKSLTSEEKVTFQEFVNFILQEKMNDVHWRPMYKVCDPCRIRYDIIGKLETLNQDAAGLLRSFGVPEGLHYPTFKKHKTEPRTNEQITKEYLEKLSEKQIEQLFKLYEIDFSMFNYLSNI